MQQDGPPVVPGGRSPPLRREASTDRDERGSPEERKQDEQSGVPVRSRG
ncbi:MAG: hypothetical protein V5A25_03260 [Halovenus sp.]